MQGNGSRGGQNEPQRPDNQNRPNKNDPNQKPNNNGKMPNSGRSMMVFLVVTLLVLIIMNFVTSAVKGSTEREVTYNQFINMVERGEVKSVEIGTNRIDIELKNQPIPGVTITCYTGIMDDPNLTDRLLKAGVQCTKKVPDTTSMLIANILGSVLPFVLIGVLFYYIMKKMGQGGGVMGVGKSKAKVYGQKETGVTFRDVAGQDEAKESLQEVVGFLENPQKYVKIGAKLPKGALLVGPPGTGKTLLAKAVAGEAHAPFFSISGSDFVEMFVGVGASRVRDLFEEAKKSAPCIIFIDEIDAVARQRGTGMGGGHDEREQTLNQLLVEMDGFGVNEGIIVMAATNRVDILDPAILRPGRFDRKVGVGRPDVKGREEILMVHAKDKPLGDDVDLRQIAQTTAGFTGADLENLLNEAAIDAAKEGRPYIMQKDIKKAFIKVGIGAEKKSKVISDKEKKITAYHEAGHAILFHVLPHMDPVYTISIIPTGMGAAGYTMPLPDNDEMFNTKNKMLEDITTLLGGRVAEEIIFGDITTGASNDIKRATETARSMVMKYGMSEKIGLIAYGNDDDEVFIGRDLAHTRGYSEEVAREIDGEISRIIRECHENAESIIRENIGVLHSCAALLLEKEKIHREEFEALFTTEKEEVAKTNE